MLSRSMDVPVKVLERFIELPETSDQTSLLDFM